VYLCHGVCVCACVRACVWSVCMCVRAHVGFIVCEREFVDSMCHSDNRTPLIKSSRDTRKQCTDPVEARRQELTVGLSIKGGGGGGGGDPATKLCLGQERCYDVLVSQLVGKGCCLLLQYLIQSCARGGRRIVENM